METLTVGIISKTFFYLPYWAALARGSFERAGLAIATELMGNASQIAPLESGELDLVIGTPEGVVQNAAAGGPLRIVAGNTGRLSHFVIAQPRYKRIEDLRGATVGILSMKEGTFFHVQTVMAAHGLHYPQDYRVQETGGAPPRHKALVEGSIDMGLQSIPLVFLEEELGFSNLGDVSAYVPHWQFNTVNLNPARAEARRASIVCFLKLLLQATEWVHTHREGASAIAEKEMAISAQHALRGWDYFIGKNALTRSMDIDSKGLGKVIEQQRKASFLPADAPSDPEHYIERSFLAAARAL